MTSPASARIGPRHRGCAAWILVLVAPLPGRAQAEPKPSKGTSTASAPLLWGAALHLGQAWDTSPLFLSANEPDDHLQSLSGSFSHTRLGRRSQVSASFDVGATLYRRLSNLNSAQLGGTLSGMRRLSSRTTVTASEGASFARTGQAAQLVDAGLQLPQSRARIFDGSAELSHQASPSTSLRFNAGHDVVDFSAAGLADGSTYFAGASVDRTLGPHDFLSASWGSQASRSAGQTALHHTVSGGWTRTLGRSWKASASLGAGRFARSTWTRMGGGSLAGHFRYDTMSASYARSMGQAFGLGRDRVADTFSAAYTRRLGRWIQISASSSWVLSSDPSDARFYYRSEYYQGDLGYQLSSRLDVAAGYARRRTVGAAPGSAISGNLGHLSLSYRWDNRTYRHAEGR